MPLLFLSAISKVGARVTQVISHLSVWVMPCLLLLALPVHGADSSSGANLRIVLVGDSITGLSRNSSNGFANVMDKAFQATAPDRTVEIVALGGSGQSVSSWLSIEERSQTKKTTLDVKNIDAHEALAKPADVLVVMLGMNDVLAPYVGDSEASLDRWIANYQKLVERLRARVQPKVLGLAGITPYTEDPQSPENQLIDRMNAKVNLLAQQLGGRYFDTSGEAKKALKKGRSLDPKFHVTSGDFVHPSESGHLAIASAMLTGMGESKARQWLDEEKWQPLWAAVAGKGTGISWQRVSVTREPDSTDYVFLMHYDLAGKLADASTGLEVVPPEGWRAVPPRLNGKSGEFRLIGKPDRLTNTFTLRSGQVEVQAYLPAPWLATAGVPSNWDGSNFDAEKNHTEIGELIRQNKNPTEGPFTNPKVKWQPYFPSVDYTGGANPDSVDFVALTHPANFESGYAVRWVFSEKDQPVQVAMNSRVFAGTIHLWVWLNSEEVYQGMLTKEHRKSVSAPAALKRGWNMLAFKASHRTWLWQVSVGVTAPDGTPLDSLRYSIPPASTP